MSTETVQQPNTEDPKMGFSEALDVLKSGGRVFRRSWNGNAGHVIGASPNLFVAAQFPDEHSKMGNPYLYIDATGLGGKLNPWTPSPTDLFAEDWFQV